MWEQQRSDLNQDCERVRAQVTRLLTEGAHHALDATVLRHLESCASCAAEHQASGLVAWLLEDRSLPTPSAGTRNRVLAYARQQETGQRRRDAAGAERRWRAGVVVAVTSAIVLGVWVTDRVPLAPGDEGRPVAPTIGVQFPDFVAPDVRSGTPVSISDHEGDVVLVNIWATWCRPCEDEMASMERLHRDLASQGLSIVAISVDQESASKVRQWIDERNLTFTVLHDREGRSERSFQTTGVPETFVLDRDGVLVAREIGPRTWDSPTIGGFIEDLVTGEHTLR